MVQEKSSSNEDKIRLLLEQSEDRYNRMLENLKGEVIALAPKDLMMLKNYSWPGNIRELQNVLRRYITIRNLEFLKSSKLKNLAIEENPGAEDSAGKIIPLKDAVDDFEKHHILNTLKQNQWKKGKSATVLNVARKTLFRKMKTHGLI